MATKISTPKQAENTREKLCMLEEQYDRACARTDESEFVREATQRSLKRLINQLTEELAWFDSRKITETPIPGSSEGR